MVLISHWRCHPTRWNVGVRFLTLTSRSALRSTETVIRRVTGALSLGIKRLQPQSDNPPPRGTVIIHNTWFSVNTPQISHIVHMFIILNKRWLTGWDFVMGTNCVTCNAGCEILNTIWLILFNVRRVIKHVLVQVCEHNTLHHWNMKSHSSKKERGVT